MKTIQQERTANEVIIGKWKISDTYGILASPDGQTLILEPRLSRLLYLLCVDSDTIVSRRDLISNIWQDVIVNEESLTKAVADLRKLLSKSFGNSVAIETIRKRGYKISIQEGPKQYALKWKISNPVPYAIVGILLLLISLAWFIV